MNKNLEENGIPDETEELLELGIDVDEYIPAIHLYFNDDLTIAWFNLTLNKITKSIQNYNY